MARVDGAALTGYVAALFERAGAPPAVAGTVAESLVYADARGVASHGVVRAEVYLEPALARGCAAIALTNASQTMAPAGGSRPFLGTNPLAIGIPTGGTTPFLLDMATSVVACGKILVAAKAGEAIPEGWALDAQGRATCDAQAALEGAVLPLGGPKGSGLAMAIDLFCGVMTGAGFGPGVANMYRDWERPEEVVARNVAMLMPGSVARDHDALMRRYQTGTAKIIGVSREVVDGHGGRIWVDTAVTSGTRIKCTLQSPAASPGQPAETA